MAMQATARRSWHQISYNTSLGLRALIERAVGESNLRNINPHITSEWFPLKGTGIRKVKARVEAYLDGETSEEAAKRLTVAGHTLGNTGDLAAFLHDHPDQVKKWVWVFAISGDSRWARLVGSVYVPYAFVHGAFRCFSLRGFRGRLGSFYGVLIVSEPT